MNYGKKSVSRKRNSLISSTSMMGKRAHVSFIRILFIALIALCVTVGCVGIGAFRGIIDNAPDVDEIDISPLGYATFLYDGEGNQLRKLSAEFLHVKGNGLSDMNQLVVRLLHPLLGHQLLLKKLLAGAQARIHNLDILIRLKTR